MNIEVTATKQPKKLSVQDIPSDLPVHISDALILINQALIHKNNGAGKKEASKTTTAIFVLPSLYFCSVLVYST
jgi:hypothetical protein